MDMIIGTDKEGYVELFVKWYEDIEILQMVKKRVVKAISTMDIDNVNNGIADTPKQKLKWMFEPPLNEDGKPEGITFSSYFPECYGTYLHEAWAMVKSALKEYDISCRLNLICQQVRSTDPDIIVKAKQLVELLSIHIPVHKVQMFQCDSHLFEGNSMLFILVAPSF
ncbi:PREDICTED: KRR1 [Prunus dulcis]|uniref:KRR-R motif-containing protein 1 n=1 Tax=Prunus dulcis TaxID=3755 RepID=A0A5E4EAU3_PRUDU|nr:PREDICTED: KRR1 [Prunus dulcis]